MRTAEDPYGRRSNPKADNSPIRTAPKLSQNSPKATNSSRLCAKCGAFILSSPILREGEYILQVYTMQANAILPTDIDAVLNL
jgi:hypothetical protein